MNWNGITAMLALASPPTQPGTQPNPTGQLVQMLGMFAILGFMFYFMLIRPQQKKAKEQDTMIKGLKRGDKIVTTGGILGVVMGIKERTVSIRSEETRMEILKSAVASVTGRDGEPGAS